MFDEVYVQQELERIIPHAIVADSDGCEFCNCFGDPCECGAERQRAEVLALIRRINQDAESVEVGRCTTANRKLQEQVEALEAFAKDFTVPERTK